MAKRLLIFFLLFVPKHLLSHVGGFFCNIPVPTFLRGLIYRGYCAIFGARAQDAEHPFQHYRTINAWFTRTLKPGLRPVAPDCAVSPVDAAVGAAGTLSGDVMFQAKGRQYTLTALLGDAALAKRMDGGSYATLYLAPKDYHRIHSPLTAGIRKAVYIPGKLWPVNQAAVLHVDNLFAVNERIVVELERPNGGVMAVVAVGATMVGMTRLAFDDLHTNAWKRVVDPRVYAPHKPIQAGEWLGQFEFGSTVILACSKDCAALDALTVGQTVRMGERLGTLT
jgi:phosphatidylserine decarboxylase